MNTQTNPERVIFRKYKDSGDIVAIFPRQLGTNDPHTCACYEHVGQHGSCDPWHMLRLTKAAKPPEFAALKSELESIGYTLELRARMRHHDHKARVKELKRIEGK